MSPEPGLDADGLPVFPPLPGGRVVELTARSLVRLVTELRTAVLTVSAGSVEAMLVFVDHQPVDALMVRGDHRLTGPEVLDEIAGEAIQRATAADVDPELARAVGSYFLPTELSLPARLIVPETFVDGLARPDQRGCVIVRGGDALGLMFLSGGRLLFAYRPGGVVGGFEQVASIFTEPEARLWARLGPEPSRTAVPEPGGAAMPEPRSATLLRPTFPSTTRAPGPTPLERVLDAVREVLGPHSARVEPTLRRAGSDPKVLRLAIESLRERRLRLLSRATVARAADRALAALEAESHPE